MVHLLVLQVDVDRVLSGRRVDRRLHVVIERESAGAVEDHVPPGHAVRAVAQVAGAVEILRRIHEEFLHAQRVFPGHRNFQLGAELVGEALFVVRIVDQVLARVLDVHVAVGRNAVSLASVLHEVAVVGDRVEMKASLLDVVIERLEIPGGRKRGDHVRVDVDEVELRRVRQRFGHRALRGVENRDVLHRADANSGLLGEFGDDGLHRHEVRGPDHSIDVRLPGCFRGRDRLLLHRGGTGERCCPRHEIGHGQPDTALQERTSRKTRPGHDFLLACVGLMR